VDKVYCPEADTDSLYRDLVGPLVPYAWNGGVGTLFAYGQTGSGKTHTVGELEKLVASTLMDGGLEGPRNIHFCAFELAGNTAYGEQTFRYKACVTHCGNDHQIYSTNAVVLWSSKTALGIHSW
jgi:kinesin family protein 2/24